MGFAVTTYDRGPIGILSAGIVSLDQTLNIPSNRTSVEISEDRYNLFLEPCVKIDKNILSKFVDPINNLKGDIVNNGDKSVWVANEILYSSSSDAITALTSLYGTQAPEDGLLSKREVITVLNFAGTPQVGTPPGETPANPPSVSASVGAAVSQITNSSEGETTASGTLYFPCSLSAGVTGRIIIRDVDGDFVTGTAGSSIGAAGTVYINGVPAYPTGIEYFALGEIYEDIDVMTAYPNLEPPNPANDQIFGDNYNVIVSHDNAGTGFGNTFFINGLSTSPTSPNPLFGEFVGLNTLPTKKGEVLTFDTSSASSNASEIATDRAEIKILRYGDPSDPESVGVSSYNGAAVIVKKKKQNYAVNTWSGKRSVQNMTDSKNDLLTAIRILEEPNFQS